VVHEGRSVAERWTFYIGRTERLMSIGVKPQRPVRMRPPKELAVL
jgi:hypothetical protein